MEGRVAGLPLSGIFVMAAHLSPTHPRTVETSEELEGLEVSYFVFTELEGLELMLECEVSGWHIHTCAF